MNHKDVFFQITKVDEQKRLVTGRATDETPDKADEIFDYESSKPHFQSWSQEVQKDSGGKSMGNVRSMHGKVAAGKVQSLDFDDTGKAINVTAKIVDDNEWNKVLEGVHTGFSIGGSYVGDKWEDKTHAGKMRYTAKPSEISLVDRPCNPSALFFDVQKADGTTAQVAFKAPVVTGEMIGDEMSRMVQDGTLTLADMLTAIKDAEAAKRDPDASKRDFSTAQRQDAAESGAAMPDGSFPIKNGEDLSNAIRLAGNAKNPDAARAHIKSRASALGLTDKIPDTWKLAKDSTMLPTPAVGNLVNFMWGDQAAQGVITSITDGMVYVGGSQDALDYEPYMAVRADSLKHVPADTGPVNWSVGSMPTKAFSPTQLAKVSEEALKQGNLALSATARALGDIGFLQRKAPCDALKAAEDHLTSTVHADLEKLVGPAEGADETLDLSDDAKELIKMVQAQYDDFVKTSAPRSKTVMDHLQSAHDCLNKMGANCNSQYVPTGGRSDDDGDEAGKVALAVSERLGKGIERKLDEMTAQLTKMSGERDSLLQQLTKVSADFTTVQERLKVVEKSPAAPKGKLLVVGKSDDYTPTGGSVEEEMAKFLVYDDQGKVNQAASMLKYIQAKHAQPGSSSGLVNPKP